MDPNLQLTPISTAPGADEADMSMLSADTGMTMAGNLRSHARPQIPNLPPTLLTTPVRRHIRHLESRLTEIEDATQQCGNADAMQHFQQQWMQILGEIENFRRDLPNAIDSRVHNALQPATAHVQALSEQLQAAQQNVAEAQKTTQNAATHAVNAAKFSAEQAARADSAFEQAAQAAKVAAEQAASSNAANAHATEAAQIAAS